MDFSYRGTRFVSPASTPAPLPLTDEGARKRYVARIGKFIEDGRPLPRLRHHALWMLHNCVAHPLLAAAGTDVPLLAVEFHELTSQWLNRQPYERRPTPADFFPSAKPKARAASASSTDRGVAPHEFAWAGSLGRVERSGPGPVEPLCDVCFLPEDQHPPSNRPRRRTLSVRPPKVRNGALWALHNVVAHLAIGLVPCKTTFDLHDWSARVMDVPGWV
jgi:hypothetical protein